jgi:tetratricopeptide (TPR) repeat protein
LEKPEIKPNREETHEPVEPRESLRAPSKLVGSILRVIPLVLVLLLGFAVGLTRYQNMPERAPLDELSGQDAGKLEQAFSMIESGDFGSVAVEVSTIIQNDPGNAMAYHLLGLADAHRGLVEEAASNFQHAVDIDPQFALGWYNLGVVEESRGRWGSALDAYQNALDIEPSNQRYGFSVNRLLDFITGEGGWDQRDTEALQLFMDGVASVNKGSMDDLAFAENIFRILVDNRPYDVAARNMLGLTLARQGRLEEAEGILSGVVEDEPGFSEAWFNLGMVHRAQGRIADAIKDFETASSSSSVDTFKTNAMAQASELSSVL